MSVYPSLSRQVAPGPTQFINVGDIGNAGNGGQPKPATTPEPGTVLRADDEAGVVVAAGAGAVALQEVQPPGKRRMKASDWIHGRGVEPGQRFA